MARKEKFVYNPKTLRYERVDTPISTYLLRILGYASAVVVTAIIFLAISYKFFDSPEEKLLKREIAMLHRQYNSLDKSVGRMSKVLENVQDRDKLAHRKILGMDPIDGGVWKGGTGGSYRPEHLETEYSGKLVADVTKRTELLERQLSIQSKSLDTILKVAKEKDKMLASIPSIKPISRIHLRKSIMLMSGFGYRIHPIHKIRKMHAGIDFGADTGTPIMATGDGHIEKIIKKRTGYGKHIIINHGYGYKTLYAHMSTIDVRTGQKVKKGEQIGKVGNTGTSTAPHLHYEVIYKGKKINPIHYVIDGLSPEEYEDLVNQAKISNQSFD